jgi:hypothetical protein
METNVISLHTQGKFLKQFSVGEHAFAVVSDPDMPSTHWIECTVGNEPGAVILQFENVGRMCAVRKISTASNPRVGYLEEQARTWIAIEHPIVTRVDLGPDLDCIDAEIAYAKKFIDGFGFLSSRYALADEGNSAD